MEPLINVKNLKKCYKLPSETLEVLKDIDLKIEKEKIYFIKGLSGSGKSTLLRILGSIDKDFSGEVLIDGKDVKKLGNREMSLMRQKMIGFVFQDFHLLGNLSALENVVLPALFTDLPYKRINERAKWLLVRLGLEEVYNHSVNKLSRGEKQRVAFSRALINSPSILLCDEPTASLDEKNTKILFDLVGELRSEKPFTFIAVVHNVSLNPDCVFLVQDKKVEVVDEV
ncbi:ABC transporter ATP-binding protein [candidate division WOR-3 bacterium]|nr:ABC transporter ATP-binding protein [candidate division WOR-3 bacterium]